MTACGDLQGVGRRAKGIDIMHENLLGRIGAAEASLQELLEQADVLIRILPENPEAARAGIGVLYELAERAVHDIRDLREPPDLGSTLSPRQREVLSLVIRGYANKEIADTLRISDRTVQFHLNAVFEKTKTSGRAEAAALALRKGWIH
jgi:DNA-binding NarL/FixJ family response regulator